MHQCGGAHERVCCVLKLLGEWNWYEPGSCWRIRDILDQETIGVSYCHPAFDGFMWDIVTLIQSPPMAGYGFTSSEEAIANCNKALIERGYEFVSEERAEKIRLLL